MLTNLIENRGKEFSNLIKIGDFLARTLRENVELFNVEDGVATYLTESGSVVTGKYSFKPTLKLSKILVEDSSVLEDKKVFESATDKRVMGMLSDLLEDDYQSAEGSFDKILSMFETKLSYDRIKTRLQEKVERFGEQTKIVSSPEFQRLGEIKDKLIAFLKENKSVIQSAGIRNGMKLAALVSTSFDLPRMTVKQLQENKEFEVKVLGKSSLYEHLCRKELIQKELLEAKEGFDRIWVENSSVQDLASMVFESNEEDLRHQVAQVVSEAPYFALATKKQLSSLIQNCLSLNEVRVSNKDLNLFTSKIFEMKGPVKRYVLEILNEKYGIDVRKLSEVPTFRTLVMTEAEILSQIAKHAPTGSLIRKTLMEFSRSLKTKNGSESIDLADFLNEIFTESDYTASLNETSLMDYMDFSRVADDLGKIGQVLKMLGPAVDNVADQMQDAPAPGADVPPEGMGAEGPMMGAEEGPQDPLGSPDPMDTDAEAGIPGEDAQDIADEVTDEVDTEEALSNGDIEEAPEGGEGIPDLEGGLPPEEGFEDEEGMEGMEGEEGLPPEEGFEGEEGIEGEEGMEGEEMEQDDLTSLLSKLEDLLGDLTGGEESDDEGDFEGEEESEFGDEEESEFGDEEESEFEDEEEEFEPKGKKRKRKPDPEQYRS